VIRDYVAFNQNGHVLAGIFWEALKAVVRVRANKERRAQHDCPVSEIVEAVMEYSRDWRGGKSCRGNLTG